MNTYGYVEGNPLNLIDPDGLSAIVLTPKPMVGPPRPLVGPVRPMLQRYVPPQRAGESAQQYLNRLTQIRQFERTLMKPEIKQSSIKPKIDKPGDTTAGMLTRLLRIIIKYGENFQSAPPVSICEDKKQFDKCVELGLCI